MLFKIGDRVQIVRKCESYSDGWDNDWYSKGMDCYVNNNKTYTILYIYNEGVEFKEDGAYRWPPNSLQYAVKLTKEQVLLNKIKHLYSKNKFSREKGWNLDDTGSNNIKGSSI